MEELLNNDRLLLNADSIQLLLLMKNSFDPYELLLSYTEGNIEKVLELITDVSSFLHTEASASRKLGQMLDSSAGITIMYHSIWSATLPIWHILPPPPVSSPQHAEKLNHFAYSELIKYLSPAPAYKSKLTSPPAEIYAVFYIVSKDPYNPDKPPFQYESFNRFDHCTPDVFWFQPYSNTQVLLATL